MNAEEYEGRVTKWNEEEMGISRSRRKGYTSDGVEIKPDVLSNFKATARIKKDFGIGSGDPVEEALKYQIEKLYRIINIYGKMRQGFELPTEGEGSIADSFKDERNYSRLAQALIEEWVESKKEEK
jgi:hypothetical protein